MYLRYKVVLVFSLFISITNCNIFQTYDRSSNIIEDALSIVRGHGYQLLDSVAMEISLDEFGFYALEDFAVMLDDDVQNTTICTLCKAGITAIKAVVAATDSWEDMRDPIVNICYFLFNNLTDQYVNSEVLCPGSIDGQLPHIYEVLRPVHRKSAEDYCRNLNLCWETRDSLATKPHRNPVKSTLKKVNKSLAERKANAMKIAQLADIHIELRYEEGTLTDCGLPVCCVAAYGPGDASAYGDYQCNIPQRTMELFFHKIVDLDPAFVLFSGDTPPHAIWDETYESQLNCTARLIESAEQILANYSVFPNVGNHEMYPTNLFSVEYLPYTQDMLNEFAEWWTSLAGFGEEQQQTMREGGYYTILVQPGLRILSFNTNYWYMFNWYNTLNEGQPEVENMKQFMKDTLQEAEENNEKIIMIGHHPPGFVDSLAHQSHDFEELIANYSDIIIFQIAGHSHCDHFRVFSDDSGNALATTFVNPTAGTNSNRNPSMRLFYLDPDTYELIDYDQWGYDMRDVIATLEEPQIELIYSAVEEYGLQDMSPASWQDLTQRMETDDALFTTYAWHYTSRYENGTLCDDACRTSRLCDTQFYSFDLYVDCVLNGTVPLNEDGQNQYHDFYDVFQ